MRCTICKKTDEEVTLYPGITATEMVNVCAECAEDQKIPIIKKPSQSQLTQADKTYSVRERLDRMSGRRDTTNISTDQAVTQKNLSKLRMPKPKQSHPEVLDNYYWTLSMARRRAKMTPSQLARKMDTSSYAIQEIERGKIPENFKEIFLKLEAFFGIKLLKVRPQLLSFTRKDPNQEKEILRSVAEKMKDFKTKDEIDEEIEESEEKINFEEMKLSRRKDLSKVTLSDLIDRKRAREKYKMKVQQDEMLGDEIEFE